MKWTNIYQKLNSGRHMRTLPLDKMDQFSDIEAGCFYKCCQTIDLDQVRINPMGMNPSAKTDIVLARIWRFLYDGTQGDGIALCLFLAADAKNTKLTNEPYNGAVFHINEMLFDISALARQIQRIKIIYDEEARIAAQEKVEKTLATIMSTTHGCDESYENVKRRLTYGDVINIISKYINQIIISFDITPDASVSSMGLIADW